MGLTYRALGLLLTYPSDELRAGLPEIEAALLADPALPGPIGKALSRLVATVAAGDLLDRQEEYVWLFDRTRSLSLNLYEHVHGESRDRGQAMVDLRERYVAAGLDPVANELPDYLPLFLDYCSILPEEAAREALAEPGIVLVALAARLADRESDYAPVFAVLCDIAGVEMDEEAAKSLPPPEDPETLSELDAQWEEEEVRFINELPDPNAACPQASAMMRRILEPEGDAAEMRN